MATTIEHLLGYAEQCKEMRGRGKGGREKGERSGKRAERRERWEGM